MLHDSQLVSLREQSQNGALSRRDFMRTLTLASAAGPGLIMAALSGFALTRTQRAEAAEMIVADMGKLPRKKLGRLPFKVTPICISADWNSELYGPGLAVGINFVHKAHQWRQIPDEFKALPRESYYTDITVDSTPNRPDDYDFAVRQVKTTLERNGLKYYDLFRAHFGWRTVDAFKNQTGTYRAFQQLKKEGLVKYFAVSQHPYTDHGEDQKHYPDLIQAEIDSGILDSMQVWFSYKYPKEAQDVFAKASKAGIGMTAMKINAHGRDAMQGNPELMQKLKADGMVGRSLLRYVLTLPRPDGKPIFNTCVTALGNMQQFEENVGAVAKKTAMRDGFDAFDYEA